MEPPDDDEDVSMRYGAEGLKGYNTDSGGVVIALPVPKLELPPRKSPSSLSPPPSPSLPSPRSPRPWLPLPEDPELSSDVYEEEGVLGPSAPDEQSVLDTQTRLIPSPFQSRTPSSPSVSALRSPIRSPARSPVRSATLPLNRSPCRSPIPAQVSPREYTTPILAYAQFSHPTEWTRERLPPPPIVIGRDDDDEEEEHRRTLPHTHAAFAPRLMLSHEEEHFLGVGIVPEDEGRSHFNSVPSSGHKFPSVGSDIAPLVLSEILDDSSMTDTVAPSPVPSKRQDSFDLHMRDHDPTPLPPTPRTGNDKGVMFGDRYSGYTPPAGPAVPNAPEPVPLPPVIRTISSNVEDTRRVVGRFLWQKGELIGKGAFGEVYMGMNERGELFAVKQLKAGKFSQEELEEMEREIDLLMTLQHPNIVQYLGTERGENVLNIFLEFVPGGSITRLVAKFGRFSEPIIAHYGCQILRGLEFLHGKGIVHRDVKGENILVDVNGTVKLSDFGASRKIGDVLQADIPAGKSVLLSIKGTPFYMAPEVIQEKGYGRKADMWSMGCTILEMATGKPPWTEHSNAFAAMYNIVVGQLPEMPEYLSAELCDFIRCCLRRDPEERPSATELLKHPFITQHIQRLHSDKKSSWDNIVRGIRKLSSFTRKDGGDSKKTAESPQRSRGDPSPQRSLSASRVSRK